MIHRSFTPAEDEKLRELFAQGVTYPVIGKMMGRTTKSVGNHARHIGLLRGSTHTQRSSRGQVKGGAGLVEQAKRRSMQVQNAISGGYRRVPGRDPDGMLFGLPEPSPRPQPVLGSVSKCLWIDGDVQKGGWSYCGARTQHESSYCPEHHARCWKPSIYASGSASPNTQEEEGIRARTPAQEPAGQRRAS